MRAIPSGFFLVSGSRWPPDRVCRFFLFFFLESPNWSQSGAGGVVSFTGRSAVGVGGGLRLCPPSCLDRSRSGRHRPPTPGLNLSRRSPRRVSIYKTRGLVRVRGPTFSGFVSPPRALLIAGDLVVATHTGTCGTLRGRVLPVGRVHSQRQPSITGVLVTSALPSWALPSFSCCDDAGAGGGRPTPGSERPLTERARHCAELSELTPTKLSLVVVGVKRTKERDGKKLWTWRAADAFGRDGGEDFSVAAESRCQSVPSTPLQQLRTPHNTRGRHLAVATETIRWSPGRPIREQLVPRRNPRRNRFLSLDPNVDKSRTRCHSIQLLQSNELII